MLFVPSAETRPTFRNLRTFVPRVIELHAAATISPAAAVSARRQPLGAIAEKILPVATRTREKLEGRIGAPDAVRKPRVGSHCEFQNAFHSGAAKSSPIVLAPQPLEQRAELSALGNRMNLRRARIIQPVFPQSNCAVSRVQTAAPVRDHIFSRMASRLHDCPSKCQFIHHARRAYHVPCQ